MHKLHHAVGHVSYMKTSAGEAGRRQTSNIDLLLNSALGFAVRKVQHLGHPAGNGVVNVFSGRISLCDCNRPEQDARLNGCQGDLIPVQ